MSAAAVFSLREYAHCRAEAIAFRNRHRPVGRDDRYVSWRFFERPCALPAMVAWVHENGEPVGAATIVPHDFFVGGAVRPIGVVGDISVAAGHQGKGLGTRLLSYLRTAPFADAGPHSFFVLPNDEATGALRRGGWNEIAQIGRMVCLVDLGPRVARALGSGPIANGVAALANLALESRLPGTPGRGDPAGLIAAEIDGFDERFDALWILCATTGLCLSLRDRRYLHWRYAQHPSVRYRIFALTENAGERALFAYVIFHLDDGWVVVDDFLARCPQDARRIAQAFVAHVRAQRLAAAIQVRFNLPSRLAAPWGTTGFIRRRDIQRVMTLESAVTDHAPLPTEAPSWFVTSGDKDV